MVHPGSVHIAAPMQRHQPRRGNAAVVMLVMLVLLGLIVTAMVRSGARDQSLTIQRLDSIRAFYAAESGANMAIRELTNSVDEDDDGTIGTISDDGIDSNDPLFGQARVVVTRTIDGGLTTIVSQGRSGTARRQIEIDLN